MEMWAASATKMENDMIENDDYSPLHQACFDVIEQHGLYLPPNQFTLPAAIDAKVAELSVQRKRVGHSCAA